MINWIRNAGQLHPKHWLLAFCLLAAAGGASAQTCAFESGSRAQTPTVSLTVTSITANRDLPVGAILGWQTWVGYANADLRCDGASHTQTLKMESIGLPRSAYQGYPGNGHTLYETNVPGVGVYFTSIYPPDAVIPSTWTSSNPNGSGAPFNITTQSMDAVFVKIGNITPGRISTAGFPTFSYSVGTNNLRLWTFNIAGGSVEIVSQTCTTPNQLVPLGDRPQTDFTGIGTGSPFRDFVIELKNCPAFFGTWVGAYQGYSRTKGAPTSLVSEGFSAARSNTIQFQLTPPAANVESEGILKLSPPTGGGQNATGVGIEIRQRGASVPIAFNRWLDGLSLVDVAANSTQTIPLSARLVQTAARVTPGQANGSVEFVLNYQ